MFVFPVLDREDLTDFLKSRFSFTVSKNDLLVSTAPFPDLRGDLVVLSSSLSQLDYRNNFQHCAPSV